MLKMSQAKNDLLPRDFSPLELSVSASPTVLTYAVDIHNCILLIARF